MTEQEWLESADPEPMLRFVSERVGGRKMRLFSCAACRRAWPLFPDAICQRAVEVAELYADAQASEEERATAFRAAAQQARRYYPDGSLDGSLTCAANAASLLLATEVGLEEQFAAAGADYILEHAESNHHEVGWHGPFMLACLEVTSAAQLAFLAYLEEQQWAVENGTRTYGQAASRILIFGGSYTKLAGANWGEDPIDLQGAWDAVGQVEAEALRNLLRDIFGNPFRPATFDASWRTAAVLAVSQAMYAERRFADMPILADALEEAGCTSADILDHCRNGQEHVRGCWVVDLVLGNQ